MPSLERPARERKPTPNIKGLCCCGAQSHETVMPVCELAKLVSCACGKCFIRPQPHKNPAMSVGYMHTNCWKVHRVAFAPEPCASPPRRTRCGTSTTRKRNASHNVRRVHAAAESGRRGACSGARTSANNTSRVVAARERSHLKQSWPSLDQRTTSRKPVFCWPIASLWGFGIPSPMHAWWQAPGDQGKCPSEPRLR